MVSGARLDGVLIVFERGARDVIGATGASGAGRSARGGRGS